jgi:hypothetical protein
VWYNDFFHFFFSVGTNAAEEGCTVCGTTSPLLQALLRECPFLLETVFIEIRCCLPLISLLLGTAVLRTLDLRFKSPHAAFDDETVAVDN